MALFQAAPASDNTLDAFQTGLDIVGVFDPTGLVDLANAGLYASRGKWEEAGISLLSILPFGDLGKVVKWGAVAVGVGLGARTTYKEVKDYLAFRALRRREPDLQVELWHFTSREGKEGIMRERLIRPTKGPSVWAGGGHTYFSATPTPNWFVRTIIYGLPPSRQREIVRALVPIRNIKWRPFGIRVVSGPVLLH
ncbi:MAG: hypothetical protein QXI60_05135 [Thermofilaceae archaeon]